MCAALAVTPSYAVVCDLSEAKLVTWAWLKCETLARMFMQLSQWLSAKHASATVNQNKSEENG